MVRIQLASNFQVVELTYDFWEQVDDIEVRKAVVMVNNLGKEVINDIKTAPKSTQTSKGEEKATPGQIKYLKEKFGIDASEMSKKEAWTTLQKLTKAIED